MSKHRPRSVLIVEDEGIVAKDLQQTLSHMGYDAFATAASAEDALARASERCPDIVVMDIRIKGRLDGIQAAEILKDRFGVPIVFLSAHADEATLERAKKAEPHGYLLKPVKAAELRSAIEVALYRHEREKRLLARERMLSGTLGSLSDAVLALDFAGNVTFMNSAAESMAGTKAENALGRSLREVLQLSAKQARDHQALLRAAIEREQLPSSQEAALTNVATGTQRLLAESATPIIEEDRATGVVMVFRDVTEQRAEQERFALNDRLASLAGMAAGVAHQVNSPLAAVLANATFASEEIGRLRAELDQDRETRLNAQLDEIRAALLDVHAAAEHISAITTSLRTFSGRSQEPTGVADPIRAAEQAIHNTSAEFAGRASVLRRFEPTALVSADPTRIVQVIESLLLNAVQALPGENANQHQVSLATSTDERGRALIEVRDTGSGIPAELQRQIFEPFFTTKPRATGLGLSIAQGIVSALGGELELESQPGRGTTFRVHLPPARTGSERPRQRAAPAPTGRLRGRILVIDDDPLVLRAIQRILRDHEIVCTTSAAAAIQLIEQGQRFDMVLSDLIMPGMSGIAFYEALLRRDLDLAQRVVFLSGGALNQDEEDFLQAIGNRRLSKPFEVDVLLDVVQTVLAERKAA